MIILAEILPYNPVGAAVVPVRLSSGASVPVFNDQHWRSRLSHEFSLGMRIFEAGFETTGSSRTSGSLKIMIGDGEFDILTSYNWQQRRVRVWTGEGTDFNNFTQRLDGVVSSLIHSEKTLELRLGDKSNIFDAPMEIPTYAGTGGIEGPAEFKGVVKPFCFGPVFNMEPTLADSVNQIYQVHMRAAQAIDGVFDRGVELTSDGDTADLSAWVAVPGKYKTDLSKGLFKLGNQPSGLITADVRGDNVGGYVSSAGDILQRILDFVPDAAGLGLDGAAFTALNAANSSACSIHARQALNARDIFDVLMRSVGGYWLVDWLGILTVGIHEITAPVGDVTNARIRDMVRLETPAPLWRLKANYRPNYRVQSGDEIASIQLGGTWQSGEGLPGGGIGIEDDFYINTDNGNVYKKTDVSTWTFQYDLTGEAGADGDTWLDGAGLPAGGLGTVGDYYLNGTNGDYYKKTGASAWTLQGNIAGADGDDGAPGTDGSDGENGATGATGNTGSPGANGTPGANGSDGSDGTTYITYRQSSPPGSPKNGETWFETDTKTLWGRISGAWLYIGTYNTGALANRNTVATQHIDNEAVTKRWASSTTSPPSSGTVRSIVITATGQGGLVVTASGAFEISAEDETSYGYVTVKRGGATILGPILIAKVRSVSDNVTKMAIAQFCFPIVQNLSAGTYTFSIVISGTGDPCKFASLVVVESKK
ncbi:MAG: collagen-like protein [Emcibacter sp.]|nr:collagen-like protein [Emcibacter sp.]